MIYYILFGIIILFCIIIRTIMNYKLNKYFDIKTKLSPVEASKKYLDNNNEDRVYIVTTKEDVYNYYDINNNAIKLSNDTFNSEDLVNVSLSLLISNDVINNKGIIKLRNKIYKYLNYAIRIIYILILLGLILKEEQYIYGSIIIFIILFIFELVYYLSINNNIKNIKIDIKELNNNDIKEVINILKYKEFSLFIDTVFNIFKR